MNEVLITRSRMHLHTWVILAQANGVLAEGQLCKVECARGVHIAVIVVVVTAVSAAAAVSTKQHPSGASPIAVVPGHKGLRAEALRHLDRSVGARPETFPTFHLHSDLSVV